jgi:hypothetical protein
LGVTIVQTFIVGALAESVPWSLEEIVDKVSPHVPTLYDRTIAGTSVSGRSFSIFFEVSTLLFPQGAVHHETAGELLLFTGHVWPKGYGENLLPDMAAHLLEMAKTSSVEALREKCIGEYALVHFDKQNDRVTAFSDPVGITPLYYHSGPKGAFISNRVDLIRALVGPDEAGYDENTLAYLVTWGLIPSGMTIYRGIYGVKAGEIVRICDGRLSVMQTAVNPFLSLPGTDGLADINEDVWDSIGEEVRTNMRCLRFCDTLFPTFGLSGGRDSRLLLAVALNEGIARDIYFFTQGVDVHPDVIVAQEITEHFGLFHAIRAPKPGSVDPFLVFDEAMPKHMFYSEGMSSVFEPHARAVCADVPIFAGLNGENFRGPFDLHGQSTAKIRDFSDVEDFFDRCVWLDPAKIVHPEIVQRHRKDRFDWIRLRMGQGIPAGDIPNHFYNEWQSLRRNHAFRKMNGYNQHVINVLSGNVMYWAASHIGPEGRRQERIHFEMMRRLNPWLTEHHFANTAWHPAIASELPGRPAHPVLPGRAAEKQIQNADWRTHIDTNEKFRRHVRDYMMGFGKGHPLWNIVDRSCLEAWFKRATHKHVDRFCFYGAVTVAMIYDQRNKAEKMRKAAVGKPVLARANDSRRVYKVFRGKKEYVPSMDALRAMQCSLEDVVVVPPQVMERLD